jgi:hypothetical protein
MRSFQSKSHFAQLLRVKDVPVVVVGDTLRHFHENGSFASPPTTENARDWRLTFSGCLELHKKILRKIRLRPPSMPPTSRVSGTDNAANFCDVLYAITLPG